MKVNLFEQFCKIERLTPTIEFIEFGSGSNTTILFWKIEMRMEGQLIASIDRGAGLEMSMLAIMIECLEMKFDGLGYSSAQKAAELVTFIERMAA